MAYANGSFIDNVVEIVKKCGIEYARTIVSTEKFDIPENWHVMPVTCQHKNPRLMELAKQFIESPDPKYYWVKNRNCFIFGDIAMSLMTKYLGGILQTMRCKTRQRMV